MMRILSCFLALALLVFIPAFAEKDDHKDGKKHEHGEGEKHELKSEEEEHAEEGHKETPGEHKDHDDHKKEGNEEKAGEHKHEGERGHEEEHEESTQVGPDKGILEASEENGIKLSPEAEKNFEILKIKISAQGNTQIPKSAIVTAVSEINVFRYRNGFYKRIDFEKIVQEQTKITIKSKDLKPGDEIALTGLGFLRIAEIAAFGGAPEGHSH